MNDWKSTDIFLRKNAVAFFKMMFDIGSQGKVVSQKKKLTEQ